MTDQTKTPAEYTAEARTHYAAAEASFERCDTDGFLSQWAHGLSAQLAQLNAELAADGWVANFPALFDGDRRMDAKLIPGQFGSVWLLSDTEEARYDRRFVPFAGNGKSRVQKSLGLHEADEMAPAKARITGKGTGLSGSAWVEIYRTDGK